MTDPGADFDRAHCYHGVSYQHNLVRWPTIIDALRYRAAAEPGRPYLTSFTAGGPVTLTFGELGRATAGLARWLRRERGAGSGDVVGLVAGNDIASVVAMFALLRTGATCLVLSPFDPPARTAAQVQAQRPLLVLSAPRPDGIEGVATQPIPDVADLLATVPANTGPGDSGPGSTVLDRAVLDRAVLDRAVLDRAVLDRAVLDRTVLDRTGVDGIGPGAGGWLDPCRDALRFSTSGSTAAAKIVAQSHRNIVVNAEAFIRHHAVRSSHRILGFLPVHHVNGVHSTLMAPLAAGAHVGLMPAFDVFEYPHILRGFRPRLATAVPSALDAIAATWRGDGPPPGFRYFLSAAAPLQAATARELAEVTGARVVQGYGLTETTNFSVTMPPALPAGAYRRLVTGAAVPPAGLAVFGNEVAVLSPDAEPVRDGETGEICMRGHNVMNGYAGNPEATAEAFAGGWFHSGDLGHVLADARTGNRYVVISGRIKNVAKVRGEAVSLEEIEQVLRTHPGVADAACVAVPHRVLGEEVIVAIVPRGDARPDVRAHLAPMFPAAVLPRDVRVVPAVPRTSTGKIIRTQLRELLGLQEQS